MARQVAHDIKNPLTPIQLSAEHARRVNLDRGRPAVAGARRMRDAILTQVRCCGNRGRVLELRLVAHRPAGAHVLAALIEEVVEPYRTGLAGRIAIDARRPTICRARSIPRSSPGR